MKLIMENWREFVNEVGLSRAALDIDGEQEYKKIFNPQTAKLKLGLRDLYDLISIIDPTSITSYPGALEAINNFKKEPSYYNGTVLTLALLSLVPVAGKISKLSQKVFTASEKMKRALKEIPEAADTIGTIEAAYSKAKELSV